jgi:hypothetical protein
MIDLMETYADAKFGKQAFLGRLFGGMDPKKRAIRDRIEDLIREERRKREEAQAAIDYGKQRLEEAGKPSTLGWISDISRSLIPGLSISADTAERLVKTAQGETPADERLGGRLFDIAHLGAGGAGAGLGYAAATGRLGDVGTVTRLAKKLGDPLTRKLTPALGEGMKHIGTKYPEMLALAAQEDPGRLGKLVNLISPRHWWRKLVSKAPVTPEAARGFIGGQMLQAGKTGTQAATALGKLKGLLRPSAQALTGLGARAKQIKLPGKWGAIGGAALATLPFIAARLFKTRKLRAAGGTAGQEAARKAEELLGGAKQLRSEREQLMTQLA